MSKTQIADSTMNVIMSRSDIARKEEEVKPVPHQCYSV